MWVNGGYIHTGIYSRYIPTSRSSYLPLARALETVSIVVYLASTGTKAWLRTGTVRI